MNITNSNQNYIFLKQIQDFKIEFQFNMNEEFWFIKYKLLKQRKICNILFNIKKRFGIYFINSNKFPIRNVNTKLNQN